MLLFAAAFVRDHVVEMRASIKSFPEPVRRSSHFRNHRQQAPLACWFAGSLSFRQVILWRSFGIVSPYGTDVNFSPYPRVTDM
jgi:hypothetical protein